MDTEDGFANAIPFASIVKSLDYPATFYLHTSIAKLFPDVVTRLANGFGIGYHGDVHDSFEGQSSQQEELRILMMQSDLNSPLPGTKALTEFRAPTQGYDTTTEQLLQKYGARHHAVDPNRTEGRIPISAKLEGISKEDTIISLLHTRRNDINAYRESLSAKQMAQAPISGVDLAVEYDELGLLNIHGQNFKTDSPLAKAMPRLLVHMKQRSKEAWIASAAMSPVYAATLSA